MKSESEDVCGQQKNISFPKYVQYNFIQNLK